MTNLLDAESESFEGGTTGDWSAVGARAAVANSTTVALDGTHSCALYNASASSTGAIQMRTPGGAGFFGDVPVSPSTSYDFSAWFHRNGGTARNSRLTVSWFTAGGTYIIDSTGAFVLEGAGWTENHQTFTSPATAGLCQLIVQMSTSSPGEYHYVDRIVFELTNPPSGWQVGSVAF